jgi:DNA-binding transcriptional LysR family regulator
MIQNVRHIRAFLAVARLGNFTRAAAELHISQPALTVQIRQLEDALGIRLFDRNKRSVSLTDAGRGMVAPFGRILVDLEQIMSASQDLAGLRRGSLSVATLPSIAASLLPPALRQYKECYPGIAVTIRDAVDDEVTRLVKAAEVDFGIASRMIRDRDLASDPILTDRMAAFFPEDHPLKAVATPSLAEVLCYPLILTGKGSSVRKLVERALDRDGLDMQLAAEANYISTAVGLVRAGLGVAILPQSSIHSSDCTGLAVAPIADSGMVRKIGLIRLTGKTLSPAAAAFVDFLRQAAAQPLSHFHAAARPSAKMASPVGPAQRVT